MRRWVTYAALMMVLLVVAWRQGFAAMPLFVDYDGAPESGAKVAAVLISGDMGLAVGMGHRIGERLEHAGIPTVGVNAPAYFMRQRDPDEVAGLVERAARRAVQAHPNARLLLIGQSFGADVLPTGVNRLPPDLKSRLSLVALIVPTRTLYYRISPAEYFELGKPDALAITEASMMRDVPVLCVRGAEERHSLCPELSGVNVTREVLPGGHAMRRDADTLFATLMKAIRRT